MAETGKKWGRTSWHAVLYAVAAAVFLQLTLRGSFHNMNTFPLIFGAAWAFFGALSFLTGRGRRPRAASWVLAAGIVLAVAAPVGQEVQGRYQRRVLRQAVLGDLAERAVPALVHRAVVGHSTQSWDDEAARGSFLVVNFWATWCTPCIAEMPILQSFAEAHDPADVRVVGFTRLYRRDPSAELMEIKTALSSRGVTYPTLVAGDAATHDSFRVQSLPTTVLIDREGRLVDYGVGIGETMRILDEVEALLGG